MLIIKLIYVVSLLSMKLSADFKYLMLPYKKAGIFLTPANR